MQGAGGADSTDGAPAIKAIKRTGGARAAVGQVLDAEGEPGLPLHLRVSCPPAQPLDASGLGRCAAITVHPVQVWDRLGVWR